MKSLSSSVGKEVLSPVEWLRYDDLRLQKWSHDITYFINTFYQIGHIVLFFNLRENV